MPSENPFPESFQKAYLRRIHLQQLASYKHSLGRDLAYLGLPSAEMLDVKMWMTVLGHITAVERDENIALSIYRTAQRLGIRSKTTVVEIELAEIARLLALDEKEFNLAIADRTPHEQQRVRRVRSIHHDIINLDLCGGFLYPTSRGESENAKLIQHIICFQSRVRMPFTLILTFHLRDTGKDDYDAFISEALLRLESMGVDTAEVRDFYLSSGVKAGQPPNLRRLRFCVPAYIHKLAYEHFEVQCLGAWYYKTFYHTALVFEPIVRKSALGIGWPPYDEFKELLKTPLQRVDADGDGKVSITDLVAPTLPE